MIHQKVKQTASSVSSLEFVVLFNSNRGEMSQLGDALVAASTNMVWELDGGPVEWSSSFVQANPDETSVALKLVRGGSVEKPARASYATSAGTSKSGRFVPASGVITFAAGQRSVEVAIPLGGENPSKAGGEFSVELLSTSGGAWLGRKVSCSVAVPEAGKVR